MFTEGLEPSAVQWVQQFMNNKHVTVKGLNQKARAASPVFAPTQTARFARENDGRKKSRTGWADLPPAHFHSGLINPAQFSSVALDHSTESTGSATENNGYEYSTDTEDHESGRYSLDSESPQVQQENVVTENARKAKLDRDKRGHNTTDEYYYEYDRRLLSSKSNSNSNSKSESRQESFGHVGRNAAGWHRVKEPGHNRYDEEDQSDDEEEESWDTYSGVSVMPPTSSKFFSTMNAGSTTFSSYRSDVHIQGFHINSSHHSNKTGASPSAPPMMHPSINKAENDLSPASGKEELSPPDKLIEKTSCYVEIMRPTIATSTQQKEDQSHETCTSMQDVGSSNAAKQETGFANQASTSAIQQHFLHTSGHAAWPTVLAYDACVRLCLRAWARGCVEAPEFLLDECSLLRSSFGLKTILLQPKDCSQNAVITEEPESMSAPMQNKEAGKLRVQVRKVKPTLRLPRRCNFPSLDRTCPGLDIRSDLLAGWESLKKLCALPRHISFRNASDREGNANGYMQAGAHYMRQVSGLLKASVNSLRSTSLMDAPEETYTCHLKLKSMPAEEVITLHPGSGVSHIFHPESLKDDLVVEVQDSKGSFEGKTLVQLVSLSDDQNERVRWWSLYGERGQECVGKVQLFISFIPDSNVSSANKLGVVTEMLAYDIVLETAMRMQQFGPRNLRLHGTWKWLLFEFAVYYGVSDAYTNLRYLSCIMEVATPTEDCLLLIHELFYPVISRQQEITLSRQEKRIMHDVQDQVEQLLALVFENYKSLDETSSSGIAQHLTSIAEEASPALAPAVKLYTLLHDVLSSETQRALRRYFQTGAMRRCKRHMSDTDEFICSNNEGFLADPLATSGGYSKMVTLCNNLSHEIETDIKIHGQHVLPSCIDLPSIATNVYSVELSKRLKSFLVACPPSGPSTPVIDLLIATAEFETKLSSWNIRSMEGGVDAKDLFHLYIVVWLEDKRLNLLDMCKPEKLRWTGVTTPHGTSPFVEEMYERIRETLNEYHTLLDRWPEYAIPLERAIADVETAIVAALEKQFADVLIPLKDVMIPKKFSIQYVQKLTRRRPLSVYSVPNQLGIFLNTIKRLLDILRPKIENQMKAWVACLPMPAELSFGERLNEVTVLLRAKYKNFLQAIIEKLFDNSCLQRATRLKKILQDTRDADGETEIRERMQLLSSQLTDTISHLHDVFSTRVFVAVCRGYWDRMGQDILHFLETKENNRSWYKGPGYAPSVNDISKPSYLETKENRSSYKGPGYALSILDDVFASQMQKLQGHSLQEKDLEAPRSVMDARSMLSKDGHVDPHDTNYFNF